MICSIEGTLSEKSPAQAVVETGGIGYLINIPLSTSDKLGQPGARVKLFTYLAVKEDALELYGFLSKDERRVFEVLISVPGVGPKVSLRVLSGLSPAQLQQAILTQDIALITRIPGIGRKLGERLLLELKEQIRKISMEGEEVRGTAADIFADAVEALVTLGYKRNQAVASVNTVLKESKGQKVTLEAVIKDALKRI